MSLKEIVSELFRNHKGSSEPEAILPETPQEIALEAALDLTAFEGALQTLKDRVMPFRFSFNGSSLESRGGTKDGVDVRITDLTVGGDGHTKIELYNEHSPNFPAVNFEYRPGSQSPLREYRLVSVKRVQDIQKPGGGGKLYETVVEGYDKEYSPVSIEQVGMLVDLLAQVEAKPRE